MISKYALFFTRQFKMDCINAIQDEVVLEPLNLKSTQQTSINGRSQHYSLLRQLRRGKAVSFWLFSTPVLSKTASRRPFLKACWHVSNMRYCWFGFDVLTVAIAIFSEAGIRLSPKGERIESYAWYIKLRKKPSNPNQRRWLAQFKNYLGLMLNESLKKGHQGR